ncbi:TetR/AcrR family transcriptional regulator [Streptomyces albipurpureus]|uniref:TetR/AcrR family transcriptional regulator n=1 Tax=Streptomyces albipurpureus TaxID=2897419 RepID=A0ABT0UXV5_9ACTN|nr:TetR/AcrR family transcriptional regulator [Streptomyces sp. CWNU-1]MCM2393409.1 TetR/AcrR family transcriptional regulator [Streptomyces sp. CWNU-1]
MSDTGGLRERKKQQMYRRLSDTAIALFLDRGFEQVTVATVAATADVSKPTLFRYFPTKEDLVLHRLADHEGEAARVVTARPTGDSVLNALLRHFLAGLERRDPVTGLNDEAEVLAFHRLLYATPSLVARLHTYQERDEAALAAALDGGMSEIERRLAAGQIAAVRRILAQENWRRIEAGGTAAQLHPDAAAAARAAFAQLENGLAAVSRMDERPGGST